MYIYLITCFNYRVMRNGDMKHHFKNEMSHYSVMKPSCKKRLWLQN